MSDIRKKHLLRESQHTPVSHTPGIPKPPNERNSFLKCWFSVWGMFQGVCWKIRRASQKVCIFLLNFLCPSKEIARSNASAFLAFSMAASNLSDRTRPWLTCMLCFLYMLDFWGVNPKKSKKQIIKQWISEFQKTGLISIKEFIRIQFSESQDFNPNKKKIHFNHCRRQFCVLVTFLGWWVHVTLLKGESWPSNDRE